MSRPFLSALNIVVVAALPGSAAKGDTVVLSSNGHLYTYDGSGWVDNGSTTSSSLALSQHDVATDLTISASNGAIIPRYVEIGDGFTLEIGDDADLEIT